ncbi:carcinoembryonic antigen-related cell adhesion molecule 20-like isoform X2 [Syngnathoides biaculeatus]|uniref:carcinoembryonic antigen-related cell adhesion molecule 20-like isoform X2 n=1 Tax=Syngnathoides biaculeatus TaxID=300417 RepID=UPI002ADE53DC|nr:carcinoembryonic antigen-related cell adhesion molecule 20-like isoform X2 [Syngnathoides biaculeatus]
MRHFLLRNFQEDEMDTLAVFCITSVVFTGLTAGSGVLPDGPLTAAVGGSVKFETTVPPSDTPFLAVTWTFVNDIAEIPVITATSKNVTSPEFEGRVTLFIQTGSLEISKLTLSDSGEYRVILVRDGSPPIIGSTTLQTLVPVSDIKITANATNLLEFNTLSLSCSSSGSSLTFQWLNGSAEISADDRVQIGDGGTALTVAPVTRYDHVSFRCRVSNAVSGGTSESVQLFVNYGPDPVQITGPTQIAEKQTLTLTCLAASFPIATYTWMRLNHTGELHNSSSFIKSNVELSDSGSYICSASNHVTGKIVSAVHTLTVTVETVTTCSAGCIAGIVVSCLVICAAAIGGGYYVYHKRTRSKNLANRKISIRTGGKDQDNTTETKRQEAHYADLTILHGKGTGTLHLDLQDSHTEYATVRVNNEPPSYDAHIGRMKRRAPQPQDAHGGQARSQVDSN